MSKRYMGIDMPSATFTSDWSRRTPCSHKRFQHLTADSKPSLWVAPTCQSILVHARRGRESSRFASNNSIKQPYTFGHGDELTNPTTLSTRSLDRVNTASYRSEAAQQTLDSIVNFGNIYPIQPQAGGKQWREVTIYPKIAVVHDPIVY